MSIKRDFNTEAPSWENPVRIKLASDVSSAILKTVPLSASMDVLDFGCGTGLIASHLARHVRSVAGADTSEGMLQALRDKRLHNVKEVHLKRLDGSDLAGEYDLIISSMTLHHVENIRGLLGNFYRVLRPGGSIAIADLDKEGGLFHDNHDGVSHHGFEREQFKQSLAKAGFSAVSDTTAAEMTKPGADGVVRSFPIFLIVGTKSVACSATFQGKSSC
jgi:ubiquinone/menaquinone biosynthesis C-methylase UbiE